MFKPAGLNSIEIKGVTAASRFLQSIGENDFCVNEFTVNMLPAFVSTSYKEISPEITDLQLELSLMNLIW